MIYDDVNLFCWWEKVIGYGRKWFMNDVHLWVGDFLACGGNSLWQEFLSLWWKFLVTGEAYVSILMTCDWSGRRDHAECCVSTVCNEGCQIKTLKAVTLTDRSICSGVTAISLTTFSFGGFIWRTVLHYQFGWKACLMQTFLFLKEFNGNAIGFF